MMICDLHNYYFYKELEKMNNPPPIKPVDVSRKLKNSKGYKARKEFWK